MEDLIVLPIARMTAAERRFVKVRLLPTDKLLVSAAVYFIVQRR
jgi:hypothetical protein